MEPFIPLFLFILYFIVCYLALHITSKMSSVSALSAAVAPKRVLIFVRYLCNSNTLFGAQSSLP